jgi:hypothetical protein
MPIKLGHFVYENAGTGCLLSKYRHAGLDAPLSESASRINIDDDFPDDPFCGVFLATWVESALNLVTQSARLIITRKRDSDRNPLPDIYTLVWRDATNNSRRFIGEASLYKNMLFGAYQ